MAVEVVLDASVAVKCFITEADSDRARTLASSDVTLIAPEFLFVELASVASKRVRRGDITPDFGAYLVERAPGLIEKAIPSASYAGRAYEISVRHGLSAYDSLYLAVAEFRGCAVVTADVRFARKAADAGLEANVVLLDAISLT